MLNSLTKKIQGRNNNSHNRIFQKDVYKRRGIHVLLVTTGYPPEHSGSGNRVHSLYMRLKERHPELEWKVLTIRKNGKLLRNKEFDNIPIHAFQKTVQDKYYQKIIPLVKEIVLGYVFKKRGLFKGVDLIHCAGWSWITLAVCRAAHKLKIPIIRELTSVGDGGLSKSLGGRMIRKTNEYADLLIAISPALENMVRQSGLKNDIWCRPNPVDLSRFHYPNIDQRKEGRELIKKYMPSLSENELVILQIGRIRPLKNQFMMCEILACLPARYRLLIVGPSYEQNDKYLEKIKNRVSRSDLIDRVRIENIFFKNVERLMWGADIYTFPSKNEGLGNVMLEALSTGLPVVATYLSGVTDWVIEPQKNGALCRLSIESFKEGFLTVESLVNKRRQIADDAASRFDSSVVDKSYWECICSLIENIRK